MGAPKKEHQRRLEAHPELARPIVRPVEMFAVVCELCGSRGPFVLDEVDAIEIAQKEGWARRPSGAALCSGCLRGDVLKADRRAMDRQGVPI